MTAPITPEEEHRKIIANYLDQQGRSVEADLVKRGVIDLRSNQATAVTPEEQAIESALNRRAKQRKSEGQ